LGLGKNASSACESRENSLRLSDRVNGHNKTRSRDSGKKRAALYGLNILAQPHIHPCDAGAPGGPERSRERGAIGQPGVPLAVLQGPADDVGLAVVIEVTDLHVDPGRTGAPAGPE